MNADDFSKCVVCVEPKYAKNPFRVVTSRQIELLELIHSDLVDQNTASKGGQRYYITFVDDYSRYTKVYLLRSKNEAEEMILNTKAEVGNQLD